MFCVFFDLLIEVTDFYSHVYLLQLITTTQLKSLCSQPFSAMPRRQGWRRLLRAGGRGNRYPLERESRSLFDWTQFHGGTERSCLNQKKWLPQRVLQWLGKKGWFQAVIRQVPRKLRSSGSYCEWIVDGKSLQQVNLLPFEQVNNTTRRYRW